MKLNHNQIFYSIESTLKVRFDQSQFLNFMAEFIFDVNGNLRDVIKSATSITLSSDQGKGLGFEIEFR